MDVHETNSDLIQMRSMATKIYLLTGEHLYNLKQDRKYKLLEADQDVTWADYLKQPEISLTPAQAKDMIDCYVYWMSLPNLGEEKGINWPNPQILRYALPLAKSWMEEGMTPPEYREKILELIVMGNVLSLKDFKEQFYDIKKGDNAERTYKYVLMKQCVETGSLSKMHEVDSDQIKSKLNLKE